MNDQLETAFFGAVGRVPELRTSAAGKPWSFFAVAVGKDDKTQWVKCVVFGETAETLCRTLKVGDRVYVEGRLTASVYVPPNGNPPRVTLECAAWKCERLGQIGRNKPKREKPDENQRADGKSDWQRPFDDDPGM